MSEDLKIFSSNELKDVVQDMRELMSQSGLAVLLGAGCSKKAGLPLMPELTEKVMGHEQVGDSSKELLNQICALFVGAEDATIEDYMSEIVDFLSIAERRIQRGAKTTEISVGPLTRTSVELQMSLDEIKHAIAVTIGQKEIDVSTHQQFVRAIHNSLQAGKADRSVKYFVLNYDTLVEDALGLERIAYIDGFKGAATGWWEPSQLSSDLRGVRVAKVHGSIDWCLLEGDPLPRRIRSGLKMESNKPHVLIYPAATKYQETQRDPFAQILNYFRQSLAPGDGKEVVLVVCGYSFGDSHIDMEIENALRQSEGRLTIAAFVESDEPTGKLLTWLKDPVISEQVRVYANKGFFHGEQKIVTDHQISWWKFEILGRILSGER